MESVFCIGDIAVDKRSNYRYRILSLPPLTVVLCQMDITKLKISHVEKEIFLSLISNGDIQIVKDMSNMIVDDWYMSDPDRKKDFEMKLNAVEAVVRLYEPEFVDLASKKAKPEVNKIISDFGIEKTCLWRSLRKYLQSGMKKSSLMDKRALGHNRGKVYECKEKPGRKPDYSDDGGVIVDDVIAGYFDEALKDYRSGRQKTLRSVYERMNNRHFTKTQIIGGIQSMVLAPVSERPTFRQFYYYAQKHLSAEEKAVIKTSKAEVRNDKRLLLSDIMDGVIGPGDMVEIDACEADVSLVSLDNNSILGVTNLFLNLADDKKEYCRKYNMDFADARVWPSQIIPRRIRVDRGSEFKSEEFERICRGLGIEKNIISGGSGSLKGLIEQSFHQMHVSQNVHLENHGLIEKRYDSKHHMEAILNIRQYTQMVINFVITHNQQYIETYRPTKEMIENDIRSIPAELWQYGVAKYGAPRPILNKVQFYYDLMTPKKARVTRKGICFKGLYYLPDTDDAYMSHKMFCVGKRGEPLEIKVDLRDISRIYYTHNGEVRMAKLNERVYGNSEFGCLTVKQWDDYRKKMGKMKTEGQAYNDALQAYRYAVNELIVKEAGKNDVSKQKEMRVAREIEKQRISLDNKIINRIASPQEDNTKEITAADTSTAVPAAEQAELSEYEKKIEAIKKKESYELTQEEASMLMKYALDTFND